jgi:hypothetical protein
MLYRGTLLKKKEGGVKNMINVEEKEKKAQELSKHEIFHASIRSLGRVNDRLERLCRKVKSGEEAGLPEETVACAPALSQFLESGPKLIEEFGDRALGQIAEIDQELF